MTRFAVNFRPDAQASTFPANAEVCLEPKKRPKVIVVMPAYNAARTVERTVRDIPPDAVDEVILVDDCSKDDTVAVARALGVVVIAHEKNTGYGGNQKTCYREALARGADIVVMVHPDYQYDPRLIPSFVGYIATDVCDVMLGSRVRSRRANSCTACCKSKTVKSGQRFCRNTNSANAH